MFSLQVERLLAQAERVRTVASPATHIVAHPSHIQLDVAYDDASEQLGFDFVVVAIGFDPLWFMELLSSAAHTEIVHSIAEEPGAALQAAIERAVGRDLSIGNLRPRLHLPMLAGLAQGPGFPNLSCLGLLADRVLGAYIHARDAADGAPGRAQRAPAAQAQRRELP